MSHTIIPTHPMTLPYSHLFISSKVPYTPTLRIKVRPHLLVPTPLISPLVTGRRVEECLETTMPVGGKVKFNLSINSDQPDLGMAHGGEEDIKSCIHRMFTLNHSCLGLQSIDPFSNLTHTTASSSTTTMSITPLSSSPTHNLLSNKLIPSHHPVAFLTAVDVHFEWVMKPAPRSRKSDEVENRETHGHDVVETEEEGEAEILYMEDDSYRNGLKDFHEEEGEKILYMEDDSYQDKLDDAGSWGVSRNGAVPPAEPHSWLSTQVRQGVDKLLRLHFIRRFPLIFDGELLQHSTTFTLPRQIPNALAHILLLSNTHGTPLAPQMCKLIKSITSGCQEELKSIVEISVDLPTRQKKRKSESQESSSTTSLSAKKRRMLQDSKISEVAINYVGDIDPIQSYLQAVAEKRKTWEIEGRSRTEQRLSRIIGDVLGQIGRSNFAEKWRRSGKMSYNKIQLLHDLDDLDEESLPVPRPDNEVALPVPDFQKNCEGEDNMELLMEGEEWDDSLTKDDLPQQFSGDRGDSHAVYDKDEDGEDHDDDDDDVEELYLENEGEEVEHGLDIVDQDNEEDDLLLLEDEDLCNHPQFHETIDKKVKSPGMDLSSDVNETRRTIR
ncbi:uncharacterized protein I206_105549 [Kwoniella pini CBS 10737]|uniref:Uncharacterized protein n=1 Tax=Kwoniella pini CBS 10737 TaxID=1296096 RepID=A0A1B9I3Y2_9TREE|nr:uncharacterized protein I206_03548 [Kwoniella pini CBS 10737]OCF50229.1 hypothetical protein I206_03548 [Kwoniella pini CBS 10737]